MTCFCDLCVCCDLWRISWTRSLQFEVPVEKLAQPCKWCQMNGLNQELLRSVSTGLSNTERRAQWRSEQQFSCKPLIWSCPWCWTPQSNYPTPNPTPLCSSISPPSVRRRSQTQPLRARIWYSVSARVFPSCSDGVFWGKMWPRAGLRVLDGIHELMAGGDMKQQLG